MKRGAVPAAVFGTLAALVMVATLVASWSKQGWRPLFPTLEYKYVNLPPGTGQYQVCNELSQLRAQGWKLDDLLIDSCGNITFILKKTS